MVGENRMTSSGAQASAAAGWRSRRHVRRPPGEVHLLELAVGEEAERRLSGDQNG